MTVPLRPTRPLLVLGLGFALLAGGRALWNALHPTDLFLDSWVLVHLLEALKGEAPLLPRAYLTLHYPLSYLPLAPLAWVLGPLNTVRFAYPTVSALALLAAYRLTRGGPAPRLGALALALTPDTALRALTGTPQALALPLFLLALAFALEGRRLPFLAVLGAASLTHPLTGLATLALYFVAFPAHPERGPGHLRREAPWLVLASLAPLYWAWSFTRTGQWYLGPAFLALAVAVGLPAGLFVYGVGPALSRWTAQALRGSLPPVATGALAGAGAVVGVETLLGLAPAPALEGSGALGTLFLALSAFLLGFGALSAFARGLAVPGLFAGLLGLLALAVLALGCRSLFDGLRLLDFALVGALAGLFAPGPRPSWLSPSLLGGVLLLALSVTGLRFWMGYDHLFRYTPGEVAVARWARQALPPDASVATDARLSLLLLGLSARNATYEGSQWLLDPQALPYAIAYLNRAAPTFRERPIRYVLMTERMRREGAEVAWFAGLRRVPPAVEEVLDRLGPRVYDRGGATVWEVRRLPAPPPSEEAPLPPSACALGLDRLALRVYRALQGTPGGGR